MFELAAQEIRVPKCFLVKVAIRICGLYLRRGSNVVRFWVVPRSSLSHKQDSKELHSGLWVVLFGVTLTRRTKVLGHSLLEVGPEFRSPDVLLGVKYGP